MSDETENRPTSRRGFFREALAGMLEPVVELIRERLPLDTYEPGDEYDYTPAPLRPPGAVAFDGFAESCTLCGDCAAACPAGAIVMDPDPRIDADDKGCRLCGGLPCVAACKTGALEAVDRGDVSMGLAVWDPSRCVLMAGGQCDACRRACPVPGAIRIEEDYVEVDAEKCVGCGMCQSACPQDEKAIVVEPY